MGEEKRVMGDEDRTVSGDRFQKHDIISSSLRRQKMSWQM
jgi:hypothetical protein